MKKVLLNLWIFVMAFLSFARADNVAVDWIAYYKGPGSNYGYPLQLGVDSSRNVYVCGISEGEPDEPHASGSSYNDIAVCKFSSTGTLTWVQRYDGGKGSMDSPTELLVSDNSIVVLGGSLGQGGEGKGVILKYSGEGDLLWKCEFKDKSYQSAVRDKDGNIYAVGVLTTERRYSQTVIMSKFSSSGSNIWSDEMEVKKPSLPVSELLLEQENNTVYLLNTVFGSAKYSLDGDLIWRKPYGTYRSGYAQEQFYALRRSSRDVFKMSFYDTAGKNTHIVNIAAPGVRISKVLRDKEGNVYVCGTREQKSSKTDIMLWAIGSDGQIRWSRVYGNTEVSGADFPEAAVVDRDNVYIAGKSQRPEKAFLSYRTILLKYDAEGRLVSKTYIGNHGTVRALSVNGDDIYLAIQGGPQAGEFVVMKLHENTRSTDGYDTGQIDDGRWTSKKDARPKLANVKVLNDLEAAYIGFSEGGI